MRAAFRIGLVMPSSNTTVETELPRLLARHRDAEFSFHCSRMRMHTVSVEQLRAMNAQRERCHLDGVDAVVLSACVQMPSLDVVQAAEAELGVPVITAATAGAYTLLRRLGLPADLPDAGSLLRADAPTTR